MQRRFDADVYGFSLRALGATPWSPRNKFG
jgi:hypothetical protein